MSGKFNFTRGDGNDGVERSIVQGLVASNVFIKSVKPLWRPEFIGSPELRRIAGWAFEHFAKYGTAPKGDMGTIWFGKLKTENLPKDEAEFIGMILDRIATVDGEINATFLLDRTRGYFRERELQEHHVAIGDALDRGEIDKAETLRRNFQPKQSAATFRKASEIEPRPVSWLWRGVILRGDITLIGGRPKTGKSQVTMAMAAIVSSGSAWPGSEDETRTRDVVIMSAEDAVEYAIVPRLMANGANLNHCYILEPAPDTAKARECIEACLDELPHKGIGALVILDPITAFMPGRDSNSTADVRTALRPLGDMARERKVALVIVHHVRKGNDGDALDAIVGSQAFGAAARLIHMVLADPNRDGRRLLLYCGGNLGAEHPGYGYQIVSENVGEGIATSRLAWESEPVNASANEVLAAIRKAQTKPRQAQAEDWLRSQLKDGPKSQRELEEAANEAGMSWATIRIAKVAMGVRARKQPGRGGGWVWALADGKDDAQTVH